MGVVLIKRPAALGLVVQGQFQDLGRERLGCAGVAICPSCIFAGSNIDIGMPLLFADYPLGVGVAERDLAVFVGLLAGPCCSNEYCPCGSVGGTLYAYSMCTIFTDSAKEMINNHALAALVVLNLQSASVHALQLERVEEIQCHVRPSSREAVQSLPAQHHFYSIGDYECARRW